MILIVIQNTNNSCPNDSSSDSNNTSGRSARAARAHPVQLDV